MNYPFDAAIKSLFCFCDEIVVCDSTEYDKHDDGTRQTLALLAEEFRALNPKNELKVVVPTFVDWSSPNHGIYDGMTKAFAKKHCTGDYCFQIDADEIADTTRNQIERFCESLKKNDALLMALPVVEYWGSKGKVRVDVNPWKWRLSVNSPRVTHGIPGNMRQIVDGLLYARHGTDGCDYIDSITLDVIPCMNFMTTYAETLRRMAVYDSGKAAEYEAWFNRMVGMLPTVYHFSWWNVGEKMKKYKLFWNDSWITLYNEKRPNGYNPFFKKPFSEVTEEEINKASKLLEEECSGFIFHSPVDLNNIPKTQSVKINRSYPSVANRWSELNKQHDL
jgi:hypothetical protein